MGDARGYEDIVYDRRVRVIGYAAKCGNVAESCRVFGVSHKSYFQWLKTAGEFGLSALLPEQRRAGASAQRDEFGGSIG